jgi:hypothetical protein
MGTIDCQAGPVGPTIDPAATRSEQHLWSRGTSFASPGAASAGALLHQWFKMKTGVAPSPALLKAMLSNLAYDLPTLSHAPESHQGWGKADLTRAFKSDSRYFWVDQGTILTQAAPTYQSPTLTVKDPSQPVRVTLVWTDPPGGMTSKELVNDLDLLAISSTLALVTVGNDYNPATGRTYVESAVGPLPYDRANNVEQVTFLASELGSSFWISVNAQVLAGDALTVWSASTNFRQDFAIFVENVIGQ